jgi:hypothetical protein
MLKIKLTTVQNFDIYLSELGAKNEEHSGSNSADFGE